MKTPRPYQIEAINAGAERDLLVMDQCGLGKTLIAVEIGKLFPGPKLFVVKKRAIRQWEDELFEQGCHNYVVVNYEQVVAHQLDYLDEFWDLVVLDEAHRIKNRKAQRSKATTSLAAKHKVALTGTAMEKSPADMWNILHWLYPSRYKSYWKFVREYVEVERDFMGFEHFVGTKNPEKLAAEIAPFSFRRTRAMVAPQLPTKVISKVRVDLDASQMTLYEKIRKAKDIEVEGLLIPSALAKITRLQQIAGCPSSLGFGGTSAKVDWVISYIEEHPDEHILIFTRFRETASQLCDALGTTFEAGYDAFRAGESKLLVGTIDGIGESMDFPFTQTAIFVEQVYSSIMMSQANDRIDRYSDNAEAMGPKQVIYLMGTNTIDELIVEAVEKKWSETELVMHYLQHNG